MNGQRIAVVGGGITGLVLALRLCQRGAAVTVFDGQPEPGGLSMAARYGNFTWDRFYHVIAGGDFALQSLLGELGLGDAIEWRKATQGVFLDGRVRPLVGPRDLLALPGLSWLDKFRLGWFALTGHRPRPDAELDATTAADWAKARCGVRAYQRLWQPLLRAKLGDAATTVAARFLHATFARLHAARGAGHREQFGCVRGGYRHVLDVLVQHLQGCGGVIRNGARVTAVANRADGVHVRTQHGDAMFDRAFVTTPNPQLAEIVADLTPADRDRLRRTPYLGVACTVAVGNAPLAGHYICNLCDDGLAITGVIEMSAVVDRSHTAGHTLVYLPRYALASSGLFAESDQQIAARALQDLARVFPQTKDGWLLHSAVHKARLVQPLRLAAAPSYAPPRDVVPDRVHCLNNACLPPGTLNNNDCVAMVDAAVARWS